MTLVSTHVVFHGLSSSDAIDHDIREHVAWLGQFYDRIVGCRVRVEVPHRHHRSGRRVRIHVEVTVPDGPSLVVSHEHRYAPVAIREAFDAARRQLQDFAREQRGAVKTRTVQRHI
jgi:ribosome-associated translation inhibitor RaiA